MPHAPRLSVTYALAGPLPDALSGPALQVEIDVPPEAPAAVEEGLPAVARALNLRPVPANAPAAGVTIDVHIDRGGPPDVPSGDARRVAEDARGTAWATADGWMWTCPGYRVLCAEAGCAARLILQPAHPALRPAERPAERPVGHGEGAVPWRRVLAYGVRQALVTLLPRTGWVPLHGAAVTPPAGVDLPGGGEEGTLLLVGPSGAGKSTLTAGLVQRGWTCISDDLLVLPPPGDGPVFVVSLTRGVRLLPDAWNRLGLSTGEAGGGAGSATGHGERAGRHGVFGAPGGRPKQVLATEHEAPPCGVPRMLVVPSIAEVAGSRLRPMPGAEALAAVLRQMHPSSLLAPDVAAAQFHRAAALLRQTRALTLTAGRDLYRAPGAIGELKIQGA